MYSILISFILKKWKNKRFYLHSSVLVFSCFFFSLVYIFSLKIKKKHKEGGGVGKEYLSPIPLPQHPCSLEAFVLLNPNVAEMNINSRHKNTIMCNQSTLLKKKVNSFVLFKDNNRRVLLAVWALREPVYRELKGLCAKFQYFMGR